MSGSTIGGVVGAVIGYMVGGPAGAQWGWMIGGVAGALLMPPEMEGPRLSDLRPQGSEYGRPIPIVYGTAAVAGNVIWQTDLVEVASESGGKGGPSVTTYTYFANFAVLLCEGEVGLGRIWAGPEKRLIYDGANLEGGTITFYPGTTTQNPDPLMESHEGVGNVPAYRGYAYLVFEMFPVANDGNRIPFLTVEVGAVTAASSLGIVWPVGPIFVDPVSQTYVASVSGSYEGVVTRSLVDNSFVSVHSTPGGGGVMQTWYDHDRNRLVYCDVSSVSWTNLNDGTTGGFNVFGTWPGSPLPNANYRPRGGVYHGGNYCILMHAPGEGVAISVIDPDTFAAVNFFEGDVGAAALNVFCDHRNNADAYILGATMAGEIRKYPLSAAFTSVSCGASVASASAIGLDHDTGYVWSFAFAAPTLTVTCNDPVTQAQLYSDSIATEASSMAGGPRLPSPIVFGNGKVVVIMEKYLATDYFVEFVAAPPAFSAKTIGRYHGTGSIGAGFWNASTGSYWFLRDYGWLDSTIGGDLSSVALWGNDNAIPPYPGVYLGDSGINTAGDLLSDVVSDLCTRAGLEVSEIDVTDLASDTVDGYVIAQQTTVRGAIQVLQPAFYFDAVESGGVAKFVKRGGASVVTISDEELGAHASSSDADKDLLLIQRGMEDELPSVLTVRYINRASKYETFTKQGRRLIGGSGDEQTLDVPIVMLDTKGQAVADINLHKAWVGRKTFSFNLPLKYTYLEPTDVITVRGQTMMLTKVSQDDGVLKCEGVFDDFNYTAHVVTTESGTTGGMGTVFVPSPTVPELMNLVALRDVDHDAGFYAAACGSSPASWRGAILYQSKDAGATYNPVGTFSHAAAIGTTTDILGAFAGGDAIDTLNTVNVRMADGTLSSTTEAGFLAGVNIAAIGDEIVYYRYATLQPDGTYTLDRLLRGRKGSTAQIGVHAVGDRFVFLSTMTVIRVAAEPEDIGQSYLYKAVSVGSTLADTNAFSFIDTGAAYDPLAPVDVSQPATLYGRDPTTSSGLTWGYYGGAKRKADGTIVLIPAGTVALTDNATNYIYATDAGVVTVTTVMPTGWPAPLAANATALYEVVTANGVVVSFIDYRTAGGAGAAGATSPLTTKGDLWGFDTASARIPVGTDGQVLTADSTDPQGVVWADPAGGSPLTTKGDIFTHSTVDARLAVGSDGQRLAADSTQATGLKWVSDPFDVAAFYPGIPPASAKFTRLPIARAVTFPANFGGSYGKSSVAATASTAFDIQKNGVSVGTATFALGATSATFTSSGGAAVSFAAGDVLMLVAPGSPDATLADVGFMLAGSR